ncbi:MULTISPECIES: RNA helicase [unclassified Microbacterium]|uniref:DEAD/DEAH box helicase n=1 Tax=unclassified Microbacterium TaxID=2609290 RepID=UPI000CFAAEB6|nr:MULTISPECIES: DEAD/DEAH box helicase [unclassified Microbacterium]PQZ55424.1 DEAD/DEAH box helicase [Microbacterium sp. MYb43]PQZ76374.1 DEAD/DEAH box helicase [Microbacterium sp. MYb40]PRB21180.1 DEAD/DEAH box helicase [Microbacterium sp. MYb54]PRB26362.1 DEAD/DEAH box helicase [Microbacterium sp. MYb50]PRB67001.1 DEAD/DEAH box helicase [Microbacterium sp. MYb24]
MTSTPRLDPALVPDAADPDAVYLAFVEWAESTGISLYPAQDEAVIEIVSGNNLILSTPTGTGKSLVAIGAHFSALIAGRRSYYTAPIKALVSEKFFALVDVFGAENVGMVTGDSSVNADAPIICCTAEILANLSLRQGTDADVGQVVMDEFHFYADPDRGWAWQVPLLELPQAQFILMSATLGDVTELAADLTRRTGRETATVTGVERPVPLHFFYETTPIHETIDDLLNTGQAPIYVVHFSQAAAMERAQALSSTKVATREQRDAIAALIAEFRFTTAFGKTLSRFLRAGIGVHHAGMLPKYRRLVEQLAQRGLLRVICGTDTLGVGINVPIRTVLLTALTKFDGTRMRQLNAREFHQIAGRAGRAGYDTAGTVVAQAPEHESENVAAVKKAGDDPKKKRKIVRKKAPDGFVSWGEPSFRKLIDAVPETLTSHMQITSAMMLNVIARGGDVFANMRSLVYDNHEPRKRQRQLALRAIGIYRTLRESGIVEKTPEGDIRLTVDLQPNFALNQPLSPFALAAFELLDPDPAAGTGTGSYALDMISIVEATLDDPRAVLSQQEFLARGEAVAIMKSEGIEYDERMELLEQITYPKPLDELLTAAFETFSAAQPWIRDFELHPKSVVRDMYERAMSFGEYVAYYKIARSEGVVLRYLSDAYRAASQTIPEELKDEDLRDLIEWLGELVRQVDSSLLDEWEELIAGVDNGRFDPHAPDEPIVPPAPKRLTSNIRAFRILVRNELFRRVQLAAREDVNALAELDPGFGADAWSDALDGYFADHDEILTGGDARSSKLLILTEGAISWTARQIFDDPAGDHDWGISATIDLAASDEAGQAVVTVTGVDRL